MSKKVHPLHPSVFPLPSSEWIPNSVAKQCMVCGGEFPKKLFGTGRHHCRKCGRVVCLKCLQSRLMGHKVCDPCFAKYGEHVPDSDAEFAGTNPMTSFAALYVAVNANSHMSSLRRSPLVCVAVASPLLADDSDKFSLDSGRSARDRAHTDHLKMPAAAGGVHSRHHHTIDSLLQSADATLDDDMKSHDSSTIILVTDSSTVVSSKEEEYKCCVKPRSWADSGVSGLRMTDSTLFKSKDSMVISTSLPIGAGIEELMYCSSDEEESEFESVYEDDSSLTFGAPVDDRYTVYDTSPAIVPKSKSKSKTKTTSAMDSSKPEIRSAKFAKSQLLSESITEECTSFGGAMATVDTTTGVLASPMTGDRSADRSRRLVAEMLSPIAIVDDSTNDSGDTILEENENETPVPLATPFLYTHPSGRSSVDECWARRPSDASLPYLRRRHSSSLAEDSKDDSEDVDTPVIHFSKSSLDSSDIGLFMTSAPMTPVEFYRVVSDTPVPRRLDARESAFDIVTRGRHYSATSVADSIGSADDGFSSDGRLPRSSSVAGHCSLQSMHSFPKIRATLADQLMIYSSEGDDQAVADFGDDDEDGDDDVDDGSHEDDSGGSNDEN